MWSLDTLWFDVVVVISIFGIGSILFGRFEEYKPRDQYLKLLRSRQRKRAS